MREFRTLVFVNLVSGAVFAKGIEFLPNLSWATKVLHRVRRLSSDADSIECVKYSSGGVRAAAAGDTVNARDNVAHVVFPFSCGMSGEGRCTQCY